MITQLEKSVCESGLLYEKAMRALRKMSWAKIFAPDEHEFFLEELAYLSSKVDEIASLIVSVRNTIKESEEIRAMLFNHGLYSRPHSLIHFQTISNEQAISEELRRIQKLKDKKVAELGRRLRDYNDCLRALFKEREASIESRWTMNMAGFPKVTDLPCPISMHLLNEFYGDDAWQMSYVPNIVESPQHLFLRGE